MIYGFGDYRYELVEGWGKNIPHEFGLQSVPGVYVDKYDHVNILSRSNPPIIVLSTDGEVLETWGEGILDRPHGMDMDEDGNIYIVDMEVQLMYVFNAKREIIMTLGERGVKSETGANKKDYRTVKQSAGPFNYPTHLTKAPDGSFYATDGYGNARVHKFNPDGSYAFSWGEPGVQPGQFMLPHQVLIHNDIVYVADRGNDRIQLFDLDGNFLDQWTDFARPAAMCIRDGLMYVGECKQTVTFDDAPSRISIVDLNGQLVSRLGSLMHMYPKDRLSILPKCKYRCIHGLSVDSEGSIYVTEVGQQHPDDYFAIRKYRRVSE